MKTLFGLAILSGFLLGSNAFAYIPYQVEPTPTRFPDVEVKPASDISSKVVINGNTLNCTTKDVDGSTNCVLVK